MSEEALKDYSFRKNMSPMRPPRASIEAEVSAMEQKILFNCTQFMRTIQTFAVNKLFSLSGYIASVPVP
jgi:hypothetical protein